MNIEITPENLLIQLGYQTTPVLMKQMEAIIANTPNFNTFSKHLLSLHDGLQHINGYIAMSNSHDHLKIKTESSSDADFAEFKEILEKWSSKYKVTLNRIEGKPTFYIIGQV